ncbi:MULTISPECIES: hypothetical protein [Bacillus]|uniref:hypothetical protein n=1 Tax=Bacillus TaxID=1386 RepID=UPI00077A23B1|nr:MULTISPECIES: hypothetical protein [Bacillus]KXY57855.1 hypothetical protein AT261_04590 [Bacillus cereus]MBK5494303.1 hypothetical protein [Bacillus sp. TH13]MCC6082968.1 hypothetical protein [Bacillus thuringiensis]MED1902005.1 hypothetical protein [Bacillus thuringiensis]SEF40643.1 hypothetical protein SAMN04487919_10173 [Bacillus sp. ok061]
MRKKILLICAMDELKVKLVNFIGFPFILIWLLSIYVNSNHLDRNYGWNEISSFGDGRETEKRRFVCVLS